ncbi:MAG: hypothetical protein ACQES5_02520 [Thermodesulfobacteriota bacterium]
MRPSNGLLFFLCFLFLLPACGGKTEGIRTFLWPESEGAYYKALREWTRRDVLYLGMEEQVSVVATLKSHAWRTAYIKEKASVYHWSREKEQSFSRTMFSNLKKNTEFTLAIHGSENDFNRLKFNRSLWNIFVLTADNNRVYPLEIRELENPVTEHAHFFPYINRWNKVYNLRFPKVNEESLSLIIAGPAGKFKLVW